MRNAISRRYTRLLRSLSTVLRDDAELAAHMRTYVVPNPPALSDAVINRPLTRLDVHGIDYNAQAQFAKLDSFLSERHQQLFGSLRNDSVINRFALGKDAISNTFCNTPDAEIYASMIFERNPASLVEVGSGFSTLIAKHAIQFLGYSTKVTVFDPYPRTNVRSVADELNLSPVERSKLHERSWAKNDILFIDSSHICRTRGDLPYLFCNVIPTLPPGVLVHVHDIFLPYDYPNLYDQWCHTEQYLLACMLAYSSRYRIVMATHWLSREHPARMNAVFGPFAGSDKSAPDHLGCSFWFEVIG
jgi:hypothetical protein